MNRLAAALVLTAVAAIGTLPAQAQAVRTERTISLALANQIAAGAVAACQAGGYAVTATVVWTARAACGLSSAPTTPGRTRWPPAMTRRSPRLRRAMRRWR